MAFAKSAASLVEFKMQESVAQSPISQALTMNASDNEILDHPYGDLSGGMWLRGNLHTHTNLSDGCRPPQEVVTDYKERGYDFLMISDHDVFASSEHLKQWDAAEMILIPGNEISAGGCHILHVNAGTNVSPHTPRQVVLSDIAQDPQSFSIIAHPNWMSRFDYATVNQLKEWIGYAGIEIYNGVIGSHDGSPYATNKWDILLGQGYRFWGYANDDSHRAEHVALGWNQVYVRERTLSAVVHALVHGRFYASTGVEIDNIAVQGRQIRIETSNADRIVALCNTGRRFRQVDARTMEVEVPSEANYVRFECWGRGEAMAWTQPFYVRNG